MKRTYGNVRTHLTLSDKALQTYNSTDPLTIEEIETEDGYRYNVTGAFEMENLTEAELIQGLEELHNELSDEDIDPADIITAESFGSDIPDNWEEIAAHLNREIARLGIADDRDAIDALWEEYWSSRS